MKSIFLPLLACAVFPFASYGQTPHSDPFPAVGAVYSVAAAGAPFEDVAGTHATYAHVKILAAGSNGWFRVEYSTENMGQSKKQIWLNFALIISAEETASTH